MQITSVLKIPSWDPELELLERA
ncbi:rCG45653 [Rattus norvegicus]|uniref:RCG45653 n=1 Tax=Rattus norvegicus TaxID=10116 RepID=A6JTL6_RAT|nr:rCG45653 [Rattus norvegicus]